MANKAKSVFACKSFKGIKVPSRRLAQLYENDGIQVPKIIEYVLYIEFVLIMYVYTLSIHRYDIHDCMGFCCDFRHRLRLSKSLTILTYTIDSLFRSV